MLHYLFAFVVFLHGIIHCLGFAKAFHYDNTLTKVISKPAGLVWLLTALLFATAAGLFLFKKENWPVVALIALVLSQTLIVTNWQDAKYGTIANVLILLVAVAAWGSIRFEKQYLNDINTHLQHNNNQHDLLTEADLK